MKTVWCAALVVLVLPVSTLAAEKPSLRLDVALEANFTAGSGVEFYVETTLSQGIWNLSVHAGYQRNRLQLRLSEALDFAGDRIGLVLSLQEDPVLQVQASRQKPDFQLDLQGSLSSSGGWNWTLKSLWKPPGLGLELEGQAQAVEGKEGSWSQKIHWEGENLSLDGQVDSSGWKPLQFSLESTFEPMILGLSGELDLLREPKLLEMELRLNRSFGEFEGDAALQLTPAGWEGLRLGGTRRFGVGADHWGGSLSFGPEGWQGLNVDGFFAPSGTGGLWQGQLGLGPEGLSNLLLTGNVTRPEIQLRGALTGSSDLWLLDLSGSAQQSLVQWSGKFSWMSRGGVQQAGVRAGRSFPF